MTETEIKKANRRVHCDKRGKLHDQNRATKRARKKALRAIADCVDVFEAVDVFLRAKDLASLDYANGKAQVRLTRNDEDGTRRRVVGFADAVSEDYDESEDDYEDDEDGYEDFIQRFVRWFD